MQDKLHYLLTVFKTFFKTFDRFSTSYSIFFLNQLKLKSWSCQYAFLCRIWNNNLCKLLVKCGFWVKSTAIAVSQTHKLHWGNTRYGQPADGIGVFIYKIYYKRYQNCFAWLVFQFISTLYSLHVYMFYIVFHVLTDLLSISVAHPAFYCKLVYV